MIKMKLHMKLAEKRLTRKFFSEETGIRLQSISAYCNDREKHIPIEHLDKMCKYLKCGISDLIEYTEE